MNGLICSKCGVIGKPRKIKKGQFGTIIGSLLTIFGLLFGIIPGIFFGIATAFHYNYYSKLSKDECIYCLAKNSMVPIETPAGQALIKFFGTVIGG